MGFLLVLGTMFGGAVVMSWLSDLARAQKEAELQHQLNIVKLAFEKDHRCTCGAPEGKCYE